MTRLGKAFSDFYKLGASHYWCCVKIDFDYNYVAYVELTPSGFKKSGFNKEDKHEPAIKMQNHDNFDEQGMAEFLEKVVKKANAFSQSNP